MFRRRRPPKNNPQASPLAKSNMLVLARKAVEGVWAAGYGVDCITAAQGCMHWPDDSKAVLSAIVPEGVRGPSKITKDLGHAFR